MSSPARRFAMGGCSRALRSRRGLPAIQHSMQVRCRALDVIVLVLARAAFCSEHAAAVDIVEISIGKLVVSFGILRPLVVDSQMPFSVLGKTMEANEFIFLLCGRPVLTPCIALVEYRFAFVDELFGMLISSSVKRHGHGFSPFKSLRIQFHICVLPRTARCSRRSRTRGAMTTINFCIGFADRCRKLT